MYNRSILLEYFLLNPILRYMTKKKRWLVTANMVSLMTNHAWNILVSFYNEFAELVDNRRETYIICLDLCKALDNAPHNIFVSQLERHRFYAWTTQWVRNWLDDHTYGSVVNGSMSKQGPVKICFSDTIIGADVI